MKTAETARGADFDRPQISLNAKPPFSQYEHMEGEPYSVKFFSLEGYKLGMNPELDGLRDKAGQVEQWARAEINRRGLEDSTEVFEFLVSEVREKLGLTQHTHKLTQLEKLHDYISKNKAQDKTRDKIKLMAEQMKTQLEAETKKQQVVAKAKVTKATKPLLDQIAQLQQKLKDSRKLLKAK